MFYQWYLFCLILVVFIYAKTCSQIYYVNSYGQQEKRYKLFPVLLILIPLIYIAGTRGNMGGFGDTAAYRIMYRSFPSSLADLSNYFVQNTKDKGFVVFSTIIKSFVGNSDIIYFSIIAMICLCCVIYVYKKYSCNFIMTVFLFIASADYLQWTHNGIRQFLAVSLIFVFIDFLLKKKYIPLIIIILLCTTIHASAIIMLPIIFMVQGKPFNKKTLIFLVIIMISIGSIDHFTDIITTFMENSQYSGEVDQYLSTEGTSIQRVIVYSIPAIIALMFRHRICLLDNRLINISVNMAVTCCGLYILSAFSSGLFLGRLPIYVSLYNYMLLPWEIENIFTKSSSKIIYLVMIIGYLCYYFVQTKIVWGL